MMNTVLRLLLGLVVTFGLMACTSTSEDGSTNDAISSDDLELNDVEGDPAATATAGEEKLDEADFEKETAAEETKMLDERQKLEEELAPAAEPQLATVEQLRFVPNKTGGTILVEGTGPLTYTGSLDTQNRQYTIDIPSAKIAAGLTPPQLSGTGSAFTAARAFAGTDGQSVRVILTLKSNYEPIVQQEGNSLLIIPASADLASGGDVATAPTEPTKAETIATIPKPAQPRKPPAAPPGTALAARTLDEFLMGNSKFYGEPLSIQVKDADVREVINFIAEQSGANIAMSEDVTGNISLKLRKIPWDQALVIIMKAKKLGYVRQGSVLRISSLTALQEETEAARKIIEAQRSLSPLRVKVIPVSFAKVEDMVKQIEPFLSAGRGKVVSDPRTSSIIVTDVDEVVDRITRLIRELDVAPPQVMIEGKIIEATSDFARSLGVNWSLGGVRTPIGSGGANGTPLELSAGLNIQPITSTQAAGAAGSFGLTIGRFNFLGDLSARIGLMEQDNLVNVISSPRIVTMNKEKAMIYQKGENVTVTTNKDLAGTTTSTVKRDPVIMRLQVTPQITSEGSILMAIEVKRDFIGGKVDPVTGAAPINSREASTNVMVKNGQTAVIGGIYQSDESTSDIGVPGLKDMPVVGWLFKNNEKRRQKNELMIFLTPRILNLDDHATE